MQETSDLIDININNAEMQLIRSFYFTYNKNFLFLFFNFYMYVIYFVQYMQLQNFN